MTELRRSLGFIDATMLVAGSMIGSGIFLVSAGMARDLHSAWWLLAAWVITGLITVIAALSYGELAGMMPSAGGQFVYLRRAYGRLAAFVYGWTVFSVIQTGVIAAVAMAFANYTSVFFPALGTDKILLDLGGFKISAAQVFAMSSIVFLTFLNTLGVNFGKTLQTLFTSAKLLALFALIILGLWIGLPTGTLSANLALPTPPDAPTGFAFLSVLGVAMIGSLFSSDAWNNVTFIAGEIKNPQRNIPLSLLTGTVLVTGLYVLANIAYLAVLPMESIQNAPADRVGTAAAAVIFGDTAVWLMAGLIMLSTFGCNNGIILAGARLFYTMSQDGLFFKQAATLNSNAVPARALWAQAVWACALCLSGTYGDLLNYTTFASLLFYILTIGGLFVLRQREPDAPRPYKALGYPVLPIIYILVAGAICVNLLIMQPKQAGMGLLIVLLGVPIFFLFEKMAKK